MNLDWALLRQQKDWLYSKIRVASPDINMIEGLISLLDHIQDYAIDNGEATEREVFGDDWDSRSDDTDDAYALASAGRGTDEDYGYYPDVEP